MTTSENTTRMEQLTLFVEEAPARTSALPAAGRAWQESEAGFGISSTELLQRLARDGYYLKMSPVCYPVAAVPLAAPCEDYCEYMGISDINARSISAVLSALPLNDALRLIADATLPSSFGGWQNSGMVSRGGYVTLNSTEFPSAAAVCSLSEVLETVVHPRHFLKARACRGILRRATARGRELPRHLEAALRAVAESTSQDEAEKMT